jgi:flavin-dependent dehydrogenase
MSQVIVVGGGLAGLSAAHTLLERGANVLMLDKQGLVVPLLRSHSRLLNSHAVSWEGIQPKLPPASMVLVLRRSRNMPYLIMPKSSSMTPRNR